MSSTWHLSFKYCSAAGFQLLWYSWDFKNLPFWLFQAVIWVAVFVEFFYFGLTKVPAWFWGEMTSLCFTWKWQFCFTHPVSQFPFLWSSMGRVKEAQKSFCPKLNVSSRAHVVHITGSCHFMWITACSFTNVISSSRVPDGFQSTSENAHLAGVIPLCM